MTRDEALTLTSSWEPCSEWKIKPEYFKAAGFLEGYELGVRDSAEICKGTPFEMPSAPPYNDWWWRYVSEKLPTKILALLEKE